MVINVIIFRDNNYFLLQGEWKQTETRKQKQMKEKKSPKKDNN